MLPYAANVRRLMARSGLTFGQLVAATGLHQRTLKGILSGKSNPHARTLHRLASGLGVPADELFQSPSLLAHRAFDRGASSLDRGASSLDRGASSLDRGTGSLDRSSSSIDRGTDDGRAGSFNRRTNPAVQEVVDSRPELFEGWSETDFEELYSHFGTGGALSTAGAAQVVLAMNEKRAVHQKVALLLESGEAVLLAGFVDLLYQKIVVANP